MKQTFGGLKLPVISSLGYTTFMLAQIRIPQISVLLLRACVNRHALVTENVNIVIYFLQVIHHNLTFLFCL
jgi:hypothetical protein